MTKRSNHNADQSNANKGTTGTNSTYDRAQGQRGWDLNPQNPQRTKK